MENIKKQSEKIARTIDKKINFNQQKKQKDFFKVRRK